MSAEGRQLAQANDNYKLHRLKKADLLKICTHYGVEILKNPNANSSVTATKVVLEQRIIEYRDELYGTLLTTLGPINIQTALDGVTEWLDAKRKEILRIIKKVKKDYNMDFTSTTFTENYQMPFTSYKIKREPKINLAVILILLTRIDSGRRIRMNAVTRGQITNTLEIYQSSIQREKYYDAIRDKFESLKNKTETFQHEEQVRREESERREALRRSQEKKLKVINGTTGTIYLYWCYMREDYPNWSICKHFSPIEPGHDYNIKYKKDNTCIITTRSFCGSESYYSDIKDLIISENYVTDKDPNTNKLLIDGKSPEVKKWREAALKCDFLLKELKRLGIEDNDNYAAIIDMHQDIDIPEHSERDKDCAGIPSVFTNVT